MKRAGFAEERIIALLHEHEAGAKTVDLARTHGVSEAVLYDWKAKFGGMDVSEARRLKQLEDVAINPERVHAVNAKLKKLLAGQMLDVAAMRELLSKMAGSAPQRDTVAHLQAVMSLSEGRACKIVGADGEMVRSRSCVPPDTELRARMRDLANERRRFG